jgi:hypothetical protein
MPMLPCSGKASPKGMHARCNYSNRRNVTNQQIRRLSGLPLYRQPATPLNMHAAVLMRPLTGSIPSGTRVVIAPVPYG